MEGRLRWATALAKDGAGEAGVVRLAAELARRGPIRGFVGPGRAQRAGRAPAGRVGAGQALDAPRRDVGAHRRGVRSRVAPRARPGACVGGVGSGSAVRAPARRRQSHRTVRSCGAHRAQARRGARHVRVRPGGAWETLSEEVVHKGASRARYAGRGRRGAVCGSELSFGALVAHQGPWATVLGPEAWPATGR
jgi:hypothetical protein